MIDVNACQLICEGELKKKVKGIRLGISISKDGGGQRRNNRGSELGGKEKYFCDNPAHKGV